MLIRETGNKKTTLGLKQIDFFSAFVRFWDVIPLQMEGHPLVLIQTWLLHQTSWKLTNVALVHRGIVCIVLIANPMIIYLFLVYGISLFPSINNLLPLPLCVGNRIQMLAFIRTWECQFRANWIARWWRYSLFHSPKTGREKSTNTGLYGRIRNKTLNCIIKWKIPFWHEKNRKLFCSLRQRREG